jgi:hypothetical protein
MLLTTDSIVFLYTTNLFPMNNEPINYEFVGFILQ